MNLESLQYALQSILGAQDDLIPPDFPQEEVEQETTQEEEPSTNVLATSQIVFSKPTLRPYTLIILGVRPQINFLLITLPLYPQRHPNQWNLNRSMPALNWIMMLSKILRN